MDGHVLRKDSDDVAKEILFWTLEGKRQRETPRITWRRSAERKELKSVHQTWSEIRKVAQDRSRWIKVCFRSLSVKISLKQMYRKLFIW